MSGSLEVLPVPELFIVSFESCPLTRAGGLHARRHVRTPPPRGTRLVYATDPVGACEHFKPPPRYLRKTHRKPRRPLCTPLCRCAPCLSLLHIRSWACTRASSADSAGGSLRVGRALRLRRLSLRLSASPSLCLPPYILGFSVYPCQCLSTCAMNNRSPCSRCTLRLVPRLAPAISCPSRCPPRW